MILAIPRCGFLGQRVASPFSLRCVLTVLEWRHGYSFITGFDHRYWHQMSGHLAIVNSIVEIEYQARIDAMLPKERIARSLAMFQWMREVVGRQLIKEVVASGERPMLDEELKWQTALRIYGAEPAVVALIERRLKDVSH